MDYIIINEAGSNYVKKYKCPYCEKRLSRDKLITHISKYHEELIPENYTPTRVVFNLINKKTVGHCVICKDETDWNEDKARYNRTCNKKSCTDKYIQISRERNTRIYGVPNLLQSKEYAVEQQKKMLANRKISGTYKFSDGGLKGYTAKFEKNTLEFMDLVLKCDSIDIDTPGPIIYYKYNGSDHFYISDIYYKPYNLIIEVKDGGDNPNTRPMKEYREKQLAKEKAIIKQGKYNYLRLTNNNFSQLLEVMAELKMTLEENPEEKIVKINENYTDSKINEWRKYFSLSISEESMVGTIGAALPIGGDRGVYITQTLRSNSFTGEPNEYEYGITKDILLDDVLTIGKNKKLMKKSLKEYKDDTNIYKCELENADNIYNNILNLHINENELEGDWKSFLYSSFSEGRKLLTDDQLLFDENFILQSNIYESLDEWSIMVKESLLQNNGYDIYVEGMNSLNSNIKCDSNGKFMKGSGFLRTRSIDDSESFSFFEKYMIERFGN